MADHKLTLLLLPEPFAVCRLEPVAPLPPWAPAGAFLSVTRTADELSLVTLDDSVPNGVRCERGWRCLRVEGTLDIGQIGVLASLLVPLVAAGVSVFVVSTFDTDYLFVREGDLARASGALAAAGHAVKESGEARRGDLPRPPDLEMSPEEPIALAAYEQLADAYAERIDAKAHNACYDRPAVLSLLPPVAGRRVLDAGCGPGVYAEWLAGHGAEVVGIDVSPRMVELARLRLGGTATLFRADLARPLDFLPPASFDLVLAALTLDYVRDWDAVLGEFARVLRDPGHLVFSVGHPADEFYDHHPGGSYFDVECVEYEWRGFGTPVRVPYYRRPLQAMLTPLLGAGFALERLLEPRPVPEFKDRDPADYDKLLRRPGFLCVRARKGPP
jgi:SAM-dependent methyltransferase